MPDKVDKVQGKGLSSNDYSDADKAKLTNIESGAQVNVIEGVKVNGTALTPSNKAVDVSVPTASDTTPVMDGVGAAGSATTFSRADHVHPSDTTKFAVTGDERTVTAEDSGGTKTYRYSGAGNSSADTVAIQSDTYYSPFNMVYDSGVSAYLLGDKAVNHVAPTDGTTTLPLAFGFNYVATIIRDLILDIDNSANTSDLTLDFNSWGEDYGLGFINASTPAELLEVSAGAIARYYISQTTLKYEGTLPVYAIHRVQMEVLPIEESSSGD